MTALQDCEAQRTRFRSLDGVTVIHELNLCLGASCAVVSEINQSAPRGILTKGTTQHIVGISLRKLRHVYGTPILTSSATD